MEKKLIYFEPLLERAEEYGKTSFELFKLKALYKSSGLLSSMISKSLLVLIFSIAVVLLSIGTAFWLGELLGKIYYGFFCVAALYGILGAIFYFMHRRIQTVVQNSIVCKMLN